MVTLRIEHEITDLPTWLSAFDRFADMRRKYDVRAERIHQPVDNEHYICIDLDFDDVQPAREFERLLRDQVWKSAANAPALAGKPRTAVLKTVHR
jgi:hypothetical protein